METKKSTIDLKTLKQKHIHVLYFENLGDVFAAICILQNKNEDKRSRLRFQYNNKMVERKKNVYICPTRKKYI